MSIFEFVLIVVSLVMAIGYTTLLREASSMIGNRETSQFDFLKAIWIATLFLYIPAHWWSLWDFRAVDWTFPSYFLLLLTPTCLYLVISLLTEWRLPIGEGTPEKSFERVRVPFFLILAVGQINGSLDGWIYSNEPLVNSLLWVQILMVLFFIVGVATPNRAAQRVIAISVFVLLAFAMFGLRYLPGAFGPG